ncbi:hypothetical protein OAU50_00555 [Planctomycetota bacterium]|nr:hypothetical protein [Planctomycetota bacterium]
MDLKSASITGGVGMLSAIVVLWTMNINLVGWLGAWIAPDYAWVIGILITGVLTVLFGWGWAVASKQPALKKMPSMGAGLVYGAIIGLLMILAVPPLLSALGGAPGMAVDNAGFGISSMFGVHVTPPLPDIGISPPLAELFDFDWFAEDDFAGRFPTFGVAFLGFGLVVSFFQPDS